MIEWSAKMSSNKWINNPFCPDTEMILSRTSRWPVRPWSLPVWRTHGFCRIPLVLSQTGLSSSTPRLLNTRSGAPLGIWIFPISKSWKEQKNECLKHAFICLTFRKSASVHKKRPGSLSPAELDIRSIFIDRKHFSNILRPIYAI